MNWTTLAKRLIPLAVVISTVVPLVVGCSGTQQSTPEQDKERADKKKADK
ncbi:MAG TPA: hypothetical protein VFB38_12140 [Chthonomonadaceae bacterium]|nr:hypothetical protein [Chthonomonadaceae bacterium]